MIIFLICFAKKFQRQSDEMLNRSKAFPVAFHPAEKYTQIISAGRRSRPCLASFFSLFSFYQRWSEQEQKCFRGLNKCSSSGGCSRCSHLIALFSGSQSTGGHRPVIILLSGWGEGCWSSWDFFHSHSTPSTTHYLEGIILWKPRISTFIRNEENLWIFKRKIKLKIILVYGSKLYKYTYIYI